MAIDTQNKRRSTVAILPVPDGSIDTLDRPQVCWVYSGISISELAVVISATPNERVFAVLAENRAYQVGPENRVYRAK